LAPAENEAALNALLLLEEDHPLLVERATKLLEKALNRPDRTPGQYTIGSDLPRTATYVRLLPEDDRTRLSDLAMTVAEDDSEMEVNRSDSLAAIMVLALSLPAEVRTAIFRRTMSLAREPSYSETDETLKSGLHPLSAFQVDIGFGSLVPQAVLTAAALAQNRHEFDEVTLEALVLLRSGSEVAANQAAHALATLPPEELKIDLRFLASSPVRWVRQLAGISWCSRPDEFPDLGQALASDPDRLVRQSLAGALPRLDSKRPDLAAALRRHLAKDPSAAVRWELAHQRPAP
jgi:hypothetical protein